MLKVPQRRPGRLRKWLWRTGLTTLGLVPITFVGVLSALRCDGHSTCEGYDAAAQYVGAVGFYLLILDAAVFCVLLGIAINRRRSRPR